MAVYSRVMLPRFTRYTEITSTRYLVSHNKVFTFEKMSRVREHATESFSRSIGGANAHEVHLEDLAICLSPNQCAKLSLKSDFSIELSVLKISPEGKHSGKERCCFRLIPWVTIPDKYIVEIQEESIVLFAMQFALASINTVPGTNHSFDDLLIAFQTLEVAYSFNVDRLQQQLLVELFQASKFSLDQVVNDASNKMMPNPTLQRLLSIQAAVGLYKKTSEPIDLQPFNGFESSPLNQRRGPRSLPSELAWIILNLRHVSVTFIYLYATSRGSNGQESSMMSNSGLSSIRSTSNSTLTTNVVVEIVRAALGLAQWFIKLMEYIFDQLYEIKRSLSSTAPFSILAVRKHRKALARSVFTPHHPIRVIGHQYSMS